jgi:hypothetical protein
MSEYTVDYAKTKSPLASNRGGWYVYRIGTKGPISGQFSSEEAAEIEMQRFIARDAAAAEAARETSVPPTVTTLQYDHQADRVGRMVADLGIAAPAPLNSDGYCEECV